MTNQEILTKSIQKALDNGWKPFNHDTSHWSAEEIVEKCCAQVPVVIFSHSFAKAFWGDTFFGFSVYTGEKGKEVKIWQHHLQQMVISEDPIKYLEQFL